MGRNVKMGLLSYSPRSLKSTAHKVKQYSQRLKGLFLEQSPVQRIAELVQLTSGKASNPRLATDPPPFIIFFTHRLTSSHGFAVQVTPALLCRIEECGSASRLKTGLSFWAIAVVLAGVDQFALVLRVAHFLAGTCSQTLVRVNATSSLPNIFANLPHPLSFFAIFVDHALMRYKVCWAATSSLSNPWTDLVGSFFLCFSENISSTSFFYFFFGPPAELTRPAVIVGPARMGNNAFMFVVADFFFRTLGHTLIGMNTGPSSRAFFTNWPVFCDLHTVLRRWTFIHFRRRLAIGLATWKGCLAIDDTSMIAGAVYVWFTRRRTHTFMEWIAKVWWGTLWETKPGGNTGSLSVFFFADTFIFFLAICIGSAFIQFFATVLYIKELGFWADSCLFCFFADLRVPFHLLASLCLFKVLTVLVAWAGHWRSWIIGNLREIIGHLLMWPGYILPKILFRLYGSQTCL